jgi:exodeoxyribonuclease VII small subunit
MSDAKSEPSADNFEAALAELETLVSQMEDGDLSLEESLNAFETGIKLTRQCQQALQQAELKVQKLSEADNGDPELQPLDPEAESRD